MLGTPELVLSRVTGKPQVISSPIGVSTYKRASVEGLLLPQLEKSVSWKLSTDRRGYL